MLKNQPKADEFRHKRRIEMRWIDVDELRHVNNAVYLTYFEQGRLWYFDEACGWDWNKDGVILASVTVNFVRPLFLRDHPLLYIRCAALGNKSFELAYLIRNERDGKAETIATGTSTMVMYDYRSNRSIRIPDRIRERFMAYETTKIVQKS